MFDVFTAPQTEVTRSFVRDVADRDLPHWLTERLRPSPATDGHPVLRIVFTGPSANLPIIAEVVRKFDILLNIWQGNIEYIQGEPYGNMVVEAIGPHQAIQDAIDFIRANNLRTEVLGHVAANDRAVA